MKPLSFYYKAGNPDRIESGLAALKEGTLGCLVLAGGEGSRLRWEGPKGTFPVTRFKKKSLFQLLVEKVQAAAARDGRQVPLAIMTSLRNDEATRAFFEEHAQFGLGADELAFFKQGQLPLLNAHKEPTDLLAPDGNGFTFKYFIESGLFAKWKARGIRYVNTILIDNALADPCDAELLGVSVTGAHDWTVKCIERESIEEKAGVLVEEKGKIQIIEYSVLPKEVGMEYALVNTGMYCISMDLIEHLSFDLPIHLAHKKRGDHWYFKQEAFIFDQLLQAKSPAAVLYERSRAFAPLKNSEGSCGPEDVQHRLQAFDRRCIEAVSGEAAPRHPFELDPAFYYPTAALEAAWQGSSLPESSYITT